MKKLIRSLFCFACLAVLVLSGSGCVSSEGGTLGNGKIDIGDAHIDYVTPLASVADSRYPGSGAIIKNLLNDGTSTTDAAERVPAGYTIRYDIVDEDGKAVDVSGFRPVPKLVRKDAADQASAIAALIAAQGGATLPPDLLRDLTVITNALHNLSTQPDGSATGD